MNFNLPIELKDHKGKEYQIKYPHQTGGKAGKGHNKTSTIQVFYNNCVIKQIRYKVGDLISEGEALKKALRYVGGKAYENSYFNRLYKYS